MVLSERSTSRPPTEKEVFRVSENAPFGTILVDVFRDHTGPAETHIPVYAKGQVQVIADAILLEDTPVSFVLEAGHGATTLKMYACTAEEVEQSATRADPHKIATFTAATFVNRRKQPLTEHDAIKVQLVRNHLDITSPTGRLFATITNEIAQKAAPMARLAN